MIPLVNSAVARQNVMAQPWLRGTARWIVVVLALVATLDAAYLTWSSLTHGVVAGCDGMTAGGCDEVLISRWSRVVGLPVAVGGLVCYGSIFILGLLSGTRMFNENRWLGTTLVAAALLAAFTGLWFTLVQVFAIGSFCYYCLAIHLCGLIIVGLVMRSALRKPSGSLAASRTLASMAAIPGAPRRAAGPRLAVGPSLITAGSVAGALVALLITAQLLFPAKTFLASSPDLEQTIDMTAAADMSLDEPNVLSSSAQPHVVNRVLNTAEEVLDSAEESAASSGDSDASEAPAAIKPDQPANEEPASEEPPAVQEDSQRTREVKLLNGRLKFNIYDEAVLGSPEAEHVVVELMDYTCPHCRKMHEHLREARERYGEQLAIVIMPMPLELECNKRLPATDPSHRGSCKISKLALAVAAIDRNKFIDYHNFLLADPDKTPTAAQAVSRAFQLVNRTKLREQTTDPNLDVRLQKYINLFNALTAQHRGKSSFGLPVQIVGDTVLSGGEMTSEELFEAWEKACGVKPE